MRFRSILFLLPLIGVFGCQTETPEEESRRAFDETRDSITDQPIEYQVAYIDHGAVPKHGSTVRRVKEALDLLEKRFDNPRQEIVDMCANTKAYMEEKGRKVTVVEVMEGAAKAVSKVPAKSQKLPDVLDALATLRLNAP